MAAKFGREGFAALVLTALCAGAPAALAGPGDAPAARTAAGATTPPGRHATMSRCAHRWRELKRDGAAATLTWRGFWTQCSKSP